MSFLTRGRSARFFGQTADPQGAAMPRSSMRQLRPTALRALTLLAILLAPLLAHAQSARFTGQVTDPQGSVVPKAEVQVINEETAAKFTAVTDAAGNYTVPFLAAGRYQIVVKVSGFAPSVNSGVVLSVGQAFVLNIQLAVEGATSNVEVTGNSEVTQVNTETAEVSGTITGKEVTGIQLNGRNFTQLITLTPGVSNQTQQDEARVGLMGSVSYSVNGGRTEYNSFQVDGSETLNVGINKDHSTLIVYPSVDAIQEIKILTSNYGAKYPSTGDGTTIVTTKSGTDSYHGEIYEFLRNEDLNAKGYFDIGNSAPLYRRNDFGGTIGGPLLIPHLYNGKGRTHFFFSEEARSEIDPYAYRQAVPSLGERYGDFSDVCPSVGPGESVAFSTAQYPDCPAANAQQGRVSGETLRTFPGNQMTQYISPTATAFLNAGIIPLPTATSGCNSSGTSCYNAEVTLPLYYREELFRIDHTINDKHVASFRYIHDEYSNTQPIPQYGFVTNNFPTIQNRIYGPGVSWIARLTSIFTPHLLNEFVASYTDSRITFADIPGKDVALDQKTVSEVTSGMTSIFDNGGKGADGLAKLPGIVIAGNNAEYGGYGFAVDSAYMPWKHTNPIYSLQDNLTWTWRKHTVQAGAQWVYFQRNQLNDAIGSATGDTQGLITFSNIATVHTTGNAFANFLGWGNSELNGVGPSTYQQDSAQGEYYQRYQIVEPYIDDEWKITPHLTLDLGVRFSLFGVYHEKNHNAYNWVPSAFSTATEEEVGIEAATGALYNTTTGAYLPFFGSDNKPNPLLLNGIVQCGVGGVPDGCMKGHLWNPAPRVGVAWDPFGNGKTSIRAGYGVFFEHGTADEANTGSLEGGAQMVLTMTQRNSGAPNCIGQVGVGCADKAAFAPNVVSIPTQAVWPYVQQWSLSVERELPLSTLVSAAYVGSKGTHLTVEREINQLTPPVQSLNPFGPHQPFLQSDCNVTGYEGGTGAYSVSGGVIGIDSPLYHNMQAACVGVGTGGQIDPVSLRTYAPGLNNIYELENTANSSYNAFQFALRRVQGPLFLGVAYTYSHSLDNASDRSDATFVNSFDVKSNHASSNFDQRQLLHVSYIYDLPLYHFLQKFLAGINSDPNPESGAVNRPASSYLTSRLGKILFDHWQLSGLTQFETGIPFTVVNGGSPNGVSVLDNAGVDNGVGAGSYPDLVGSPKTHHVKNTGGSSSGPLLLNPAAFAAPRGLTFGTAGRNVLNNPSRWNFDTAMQKDFHLPVLGESTSLQFRAEAFNVFNHTQFRIYNPTLGNQANNTIGCYGPDSYSAGDPGGEESGDNGCLAGQSFLHPVDAHRPRTIQFGLKLAF